MTPVSKQHCCSNCGKVWDCPTVKICVMPIVILCSRCSNQAKKDHIITEFGDEK